MITEPQPPSQVPSTGTSQALTTETAVARPAPRGSYPLITGLYVTQYVGIGFLASALIVILRGTGTPLDQLGLISLVGIIWPIKFLWAPILDRWGSARFGHYRGWILVLQPLMVLTILAMLPFGDLTDLGAIVVLAILLACLSATQDTASDALAIRAMHGQARGIVNGIQVMGGYLGNLLGGGVTLIIYGVAGWTPAILFLAVVTALPLITLALYREPARATDRAQPTLGQAFRALGNVLKQPGAPTWALAVSGTAMLVATVPFILITFGGAPFAGTAITLGLVMFAYTALSAVMLTVSMDYARPSTAGTDSTLIVSIAQLASFLASALSLVAAEYFGYTSVAWFSIALTGAAVALGLRHLRVHGAYLASRA